MGRQPPVTTWLIFRARDRSTRTTRRRPNLEWDEICWRIDLNVPDTWGQLISTISIDLPEVSPPTIMIEEMA